MRQLTVVILLAALPLVQAASQEQPYAGLEQRDIKALSSEQVEGYLNGEGMALALAAELNGYPGPKHVLELASALDLETEQRVAVRELYHAMREAAIAEGRKIIAMEASLDSLFAEGTIDAGQLAERLEALGLAQGRLRYLHLEAHLRTRVLLSEAQVERYQHLRGYGAGGVHPAGHDEGHH